MHLGFRLSIIFSLFFLTACQQTPYLAEHKVLSFGTVIDIVIATSNEKKALADLAINDIEQLLKNRHHEWHAWQKGDLFNLNQSLPSETLLNNKNIEHLILRSKEYYTTTNGLFNPAMGLLIKAWGFHGTASPDYELIEKIKRQMPTMQHIQLNGNKVSSDNPYAQLDFGGIAKGLAIEQIHIIFKQYGLKNYLINIGGDLNASGMKFSEAWRVGIQNPYQQGAIATMTLSNQQNLFTSGNYQRFSTHKKQKTHHIIDPISGEPSQRANAVTVMHSNALTADVAATALMIASPQERLIISQQLNVIDYLIVTANNEIWVSSSLFKKLTFNTELKIHIIDE